MMYVVWKLPLVPTLLLVAWLGKHEYAPFAFHPQTSGLVGTDADILSVYRNILFFPGDSVVVTYWVSGS